ncbi:Helix-turn-helix type 3 domain protein [Candidatus Thiomargarita nelsonii]|uniref:Helix-turn-helix type 3 domain protein n=1 Tax=Candidatus Thiomargarita nelsonii TaxID=1003181 RepID=A0A176S2B0_9GAMM|nr:Helix-turn-helix type 3 domain protein [Candidatus Thiomargarita nelsonii]
MTGAQLKKWREDFGLAQKQLSHLLAVDKSTISAWEIRRWRAFKDFEQGEFLKFFRKFDTNF